MSSDISRIRVFSTHPHSCSYLSDREAKTLFIDPNIEIDASLYSRLCDMGFRRSGNHIYRPDCDSCQACISIRLPVFDVKLRRSQKRILKKNQDLVVKQVERIDTEQHFALYSRYINQKHSDGDMYPPKWEEYHSFLCKRHDVTRYFEFYAGEQLIAVSVSDLLQQGLSAIYTYYETDFMNRSPGMFSILWQIELAKSLHLPFLYLGYWIKECEKMNYKDKFRPMELLLNGKWTLIE